jgi:hypothetical protein
MTITATFIKDLDLGSRGDQKLYRLSESVPYGWHDEDEGRPTTEYVVISGVCNQYAHETYIFPGDADGEIIDWGEMDGSFRGAVDHERAIREAGWSPA